MTVIQTRGELNPLPIKAQTRMELYHFEIGFPSWFKAPTATVKPEYGSHSRKEALTDRYGNITLPETMDLGQSKVIGLGVEGNKVVKMVVRGQLDSTRDICVVLTNTGFVKTVWVNLRSDTHKTLDRTKYVNP